MRLLVQSLTLLAATSAFAAEPASVEAQLSEARTRYHVATAGLSPAQATLAQAQGAFRGCQNGKLQLEFKSALVTLESARKTLEKGRRETESFRRTLEATRTRIEAGHHVRHESADEREAKERHYLERLGQDYVAPLGHLAALFEQYTGGVTEYATTLEQYATFCAQPGYTNGAGKAFVAGLVPKIDALTVKANRLVNEASGVAARDVSSK